MPIPDYQSIMLPFLRLVGDGQTHRMPDIVEVLAGQFDLSAADRKQLLPSGKQHTFVNRVGWARTYLKKAGLLESPQRGYFRISERGIQLLGQNLERVDVHVLEQYEEFRLWRNRSKPRSQPDTDRRESERDQTPEEALEESYQELRGALAAELIDRVKAAPPQFFETLVVDLLVRMGYGGSRKDAGQAIGGSHDGGIDGVIKEDKLGLDRLYVQAKRWESSVGRPVVQGFAGSLEGVRAKRGILITTSHFTKEAHDYVDNIEKRIVLIDGERLAELMLDTGVGVSTTARYDVMRIDTDYFVED